jgi:uncharacterized protein
MTIKEQLAAELKAAMLAKDGRRRDVIRQVESEVALLKSEPGFEGEVDDDVYRKVIAAYVKKMTKSRDEYLGYGERGAEMAEKLDYEVEYLGQWLPQKVDEDQTRALVESAVAELGVAGDEKAAGRVTGHLMKNHGKDLDGGLVNKIVREVISGG